MTSSGYDFLAREVESNSKVSVIIERISIESSSKSLSLRSLNGSLKALILNSIFKRTNNQLFIISSSNDKAESLFSDMQTLLNEPQIILLTEPRKSLRIKDNSASDNYSWLIDGISQIANSKNSIVIATEDIFNHRIPKPRILNENLISIKEGSTIDYDSLVRELLLNGFEKMDYVSQQGELAVRGGILDIFPPGWFNPIRIEFWGNEIDSIREFDALTQRSNKKMSEVSFIAAMFPALMESDTEDILAYLSENTIIIYDEAYIPNKEISDKLTLYKKVIVNDLFNEDARFECIPQPKLHGTVKSFCELLINLNREGNRIFISADSKIHLDRIRELVENSLEYREIDNPEDIISNSEIQNLLSSIKWLDSTLSEGFIWNDAKIAFFTEHELFDRIRINTNARRRSKSAITLKDLKHLNIGDYVVHEDKGVGVFQGFEKIMLGGSLQDCVRLSYADGDILYVHLNYIHKIQKFTAEEGIAPRVSKLGSGEWSRKKSRAKKKLKDIARDLIKLYAERKQQAGFAYPSDSLWQKEFEASFIYEDTPDQSKTTDEVKGDMQNDTPMDRLVCGDVGFGKTEIAIRAAFKAAQSAKQVAVLVPTTILAQQHYLSFKDRLNRYPVNVDVISRFRTKQEQIEILEKLKAGSIDILIGTHRILSKDINFKDLGLLIIDEEHRFGVSAKEKLRQIKVNIDTLTLTATPIPRTLNFSLMGARDLSIIETPPRNRLSVFTEISFWGNDFIKDAIKSELGRGGQVFFVNDKIDGLDKIASDLKMLIPQIKYGIAHGQMNSTELENVMEKFIEGKFNVLVTTKIIESGLDIPNANTIIINNAQNFGLAELYQLRGRVGRTNKQAYCYLVIPNVKNLNQKALQRLQAIEEFTDLGSGFHLAMRDLEIRGSGNILGAEQSGYISEMGFELFQKILDEAVAEVRFQEFRDVFKDQPIPRQPSLENEDIEIEINSDALIPEHYIASDTDRFAYYKKMYNTRTNEEIQSVRDEMTDKFGKAPQEVIELLFVVQIRIAALNTGFKKITVRSDKLIAEFPPAENQEYYETIFPFFSDLITIFNDARITQKNKKLLLEIPISKKSEAIEHLWRIKRMIESNI